jgi:hypothetical protein
MPRISYAFFTLAVLCALSGMALGMQMGASQDFAMRDVHAHINLAGWASLAIMGGFYALDRGAPQRLAWINFALSGLGGVLLPIAIAFIASGKPIGDLLAMLGGSAAFLGMLTFAVVVIGGWRRTGRA